MMIMNQYLQGYLLLTAFAQWSLAYSWHGAQRLTRSSLVSTRIPDKVFAKTRLFALKNEPTEEELDKLKLDVSKLSKDEQERLDRIQKIAMETEDMLVESGLSVRNGLKTGYYNADTENEAPDPVEIAVRDTNWSGQSNVIESRISERNFDDFLSRPGLATGDVLSLLTFALLGE